MSHSTQPSSAGKVDFSFFLRKQKIHLRRMFENSPLRPYYSKNRKAQSRELKKEKV